MIEHICIPHFDTTSAAAYIRSAFVIPAKAEAITNFAYGTITVTFNHKGAHFATFICSPLRDWRK